MIYSLLPLHLRFRQFSDQLQRGSQETYQGKGKEDCAQSAATASTRVPSDSECMKSVTAYWGKARVGDESGCIDAKAKPKTEIWAGGNVFFVPPEANAPALPPGRRMEKGDQRWTIESSAMRKA